VQQVTHKQICYDTITPTQRYLIGYQPVVRLHKTAIFSIHTEVFNFMKIITVLTLSAALLISGCASKEIASPEEGANPSAQGNIPQPTSDAANFCFFTGQPPSNVKYQVITPLKVGKGTYGNVREILPTLVERAQARGADAIIHYAGSQRFGFWPWRFIRPVVRGEAIRWLEPLGQDCEGLGGSTLQSIIETDSPPAQ
jgi:hypothetical protein